MNRPGLELELLNPKASLLTKRQNMTMTKLMSKGKFPIISGKRGYTVLI